MSQYTRYPVPFGPLPIFDSAVNLPPFETDGYTAIVRDTNTIYVFDTGTNSWIPVATPGAAIAIDGLTGDVTATGPGVVPATISANAVSNSKLAQMPNNTVKGNKSGVTADPQDLTLSDVTEATSSVLTITNGSKAVVSAANLSIQVKQSSTVQSGYLSSTDWNTFNNKQNALTLGNLTDVGTDGIVITGGTGAVVGAGTSIAQHVADATHNGYLSSTDFNTFNAKQPAGNYLTALTGDATASGPGSAALTLATVNGSPGTFGSSTLIPVVTVNGKGLVTAVTTASVTSGINQLTGDVTAGPGTGSQVATIASGAVTNAKQANMAANTIKGRITSSGAPQDLTAGQARAVSVTNRASFVFQPGGTPTNLTGGNTYDTWSTLYTDLLLCQGERVIAIDDQFATATMPAGTYDLSGTTISCIAGPTGSAPSLFLANGCVWSRLPNTITGNITIVSLSASPIWTSPSTGAGAQAILVIDFASTLQNSGTAEMFKIGGSGGTGDILLVIYGVGSSIANTGYEIFNIVNDGGLLLFGNVASSTGQNTIRGDVTAFVINQWGVGSYTYNTTQTNMAGAVVSSLIDAALYHYYNDNTLGGLPGLNAGDVETAIVNLAGGGQVVDRNTATNGGSHTISNFAKLCILDNSALIASYTVTMPAAPEDGKEVTICAPFAITVLTVSPNVGQSFFTGGAITTFAANGYVRYTWQSSPAKWYRTG